MITAKECFAKFGDPTLEKFLIVWDVPQELELGVIPKKIYCHKLMVAPLTQGFKNVIDRGLVSELKTWDGCFNIRKKRGATSLSIHSWALAFDANAAWNQFGKPPTMSKALVACFIDAGFDWGGYWAKPDGMHFQLSSI